MNKRFVKLNKGTVETGWKTKGCEDGKHTNCNSLKCSCACHKFQK